MLLHYPAFGPERWLAWSGPLNAENVQRVVDSPLRQQVIERVLAGDSAVWILIDSGDAQKDAEAESLLRAELAQLEEKLKLPPRELLEAEQEFQPDTQVELRIGFSLFRLRRDDPSEQVFLSMLLNSEPDLAEFNEPMAIPIFGRGRTFFALVGKGISPENIADNCQFICGDCSCQVKEQNPGTDLLMAVNWDQQVKGSAFPNVPLPELTGIGGLEAIASQSLADASPAATSQSPTTTPPQTPVDMPSSSSDNGDAPDTADNRLLSQCGPEHRCRGQPVQHRRRRPVAATGPGINRCAGCRPVWRQAADLDGLRGGPGGSGDCRWFSVDAPATNILGWAEP